MITYMILIILIVIVFFFVSTTIYKKAYMKKINTKSSLVKSSLMDYRVFFRLILILSLGLILVTIVIFPKYYERNLYNSITPSTQLTLVSKTLYYDNDPDKKGYYLTFEVTSEIHKEEFGNYIEVKLNDDIDNFAYNSMVLGHEYYVTFSYYGKYNSFQEAYSKTTMYLSSAQAHPSNVCNITETYKKCDIDYFD